MTLSGKKALVTGGRRRIGRGIVLALAEAGCDVGVNDIEQDADGEETLRLVREMGREAEFYAADISDSGQVQGMVEAFLGRFGRIDILVNNPYWSQNKPFLEIDEAAWDRTLDVCLKGFWGGQSRDFAAHGKYGFGSWAIRNSMQCGDAGVYEYGSHFWNRSTSCGQCAGGVAFVHSAQAAGNT